MITPLHDDIHHSRHSMVRACQRAIDQITLNLLFEFGTPFYRQGMVFYTVLEKDCPDSISHKAKSKLKNLIVLLGSNGKQIVTCYRTKNAVKFLRKKSKELIKRRRFSRRP